MKTFIAAPRDGTTVGPALKAVFAGLLACIVVFVVLFKVASFENLKNDPMWAVYGLVITAFIFMRFLLAALYRPKHATGHRPTVAIIVPAYNEPDIARTLEACLTVDYPRELIEVVVVDDKSTDDTLRRIYEVWAYHPHLTVIPAKVNGGKRVAMAIGMEAAPDAEVYVFIDSDSQVAPGAVELHRPVLQGGRRGCGGRPHRRGEPAAQHADADAGDAVLHRVPHLQVGGGVVRFSDVLPRLLLRLPARGRRATGPTVAGPDVPGYAIDVRRRPQPDQLRPAEELAGALRTGRGGDHQRARAPAPIPQAAAALEEVMAARNPQGGKSCQAQAPGDGDDVRPVDHPAAAGSTGRAAGHGGAAALHRQPALLVLRRRGLHRADLRHVLPDEQAGPPLVAGHFLHAVLHHCAGTPDAVRDGDYPRFEVGNTMTENTMTHRAEDCGCLTHAPPKTMNRRRYLGVTALTTLAVGGYLAGPAAWQWNRAAEHAARRGQVLEQIDTVAGPVDPALIARLRATTTSPQAAPIILTYHDIGYTKSQYSVTPETFAAQMRMLHDAGWTTLAAAQLDRWIDGEPLPPRSVVITFDDGCGSVWKYADPMLKRYDQHALAFIITGFVGTHAAVLHELGPHHGSAQQRPLGRAGAHSRGSRVRAADNEGNDGPFLTTAMWLAGPEPGGDGRGVPRAGRGDLTECKRQFQIRKSARPGVLRLPVLRARGGGHPRDGALLFRVGMLDDGRSIQATSTEDWPRG